MNRIGIILSILALHFFLSPHGVYGGSDTTSAAPKAAPSTEAGSEVAGGTDPYMAAREFYCAEEFEQAIDLLAAPATATPLDFDVTILYAKALLGKCNKLKRYNDTFYRELVHRPYEIGLRLHNAKPSRPEPYFIVAKSLLINDSPAKAKRAIEKAIYFASSEHEDYACYMEVMGDCLRVQENSDPQELKEAVKAYKAALDLGAKEKNFKDRVKKKLKKVRAMLKNKNKSRGKKKK